MGGRQKTEPRPSARRPDRNRQALRATGDPILLVVTALLLPSLLLAERATYPPKYSGGRFRVNRTRRGCMPTRSRDGFFVELAIINFLQFSPPLTIN